MIKDSLWKSGKEIFRQIIICAFLMIVLFGGYFFIKMHIERMYEKADDYFWWTHQIESISLENDEVVIKGWAFRQAQDAVENAYQIILYDLDSGKSLYPDMQYLDREDVDLYFSCEYDFLNTGFIANISAKKIDLDNGVYEILLRPTDNPKAYSTGVYYTAGKMTYVNPEIYEALDVKGTDLERVIDGGIVRVYRPDIGLYIYQYQGDLYWIVDENFMLEEDGETQLWCQARTTQVERLPQHQLERNQTYDDMSFCFEEKEVQDMKMGKYRVVKRSLPTNYAVTRIEIGYHAEQWEWRFEFRPFYILE